MKQLHLVFVGDEVICGNFPPTFTFKSNEAQKERPDLEVREVHKWCLSGEFLLRCFSLGYVVFKIRC